MSDLTKNPLLFDAASTVADWTDQFHGDARVVLIQWIDDAGDIVHDSTFGMTINGVSLITQLQPLNDALGYGAVAWEVGPFCPGIPMILNVDDMDEGHLIVWID